MKQLLLDKLNERCAGAVESVSESRGELTLVVKKADIARVGAALRDEAELGFDSLRDLCGVDYYRPNDRYEVVYNVFSIRNKFRLRLKVRVDESDLRVPTVTGVWPAANWHEREAYDMFGILFEGHPDLRRIYMPEEFQHFPLRKEFPLMGIPGSLALPRK